MTGRSDVIEIRVWGKAFDVLPVSIDFAGAETLFESYSEC